VQLVMVFMSALLATGQAEAYVGPGLGAGTIGVILGLLASIVLALFAILWYPIKRFLKKKKTSTVSTDEQPKGGA
jgi:preprotein translocase subunit SecF